MQNRMMNPPRPVRRSTNCFDTEAQKLEISSAEYALWHTWRRRYYKYWKYRQSAASVAYQPDTRLYNVTFQRLFTYISEVIEQNDLLEAS